MIAALPLFHTIAGKPVIVLGEGDVADARRRLVERAGGEVVADVALGLSRGARLAFIAREDSAMAEADAAQLRAAGVLINVADRPALCDFIMPSILDRNPVLVAIGTGGVSAGLAKALRLRLDALLPASLGRLAEALGAARTALRARFPDAGERRRALDTALAEGGVLDPLADTSIDRVSVWMSEGIDVNSSEIIEIITLSDDPDDLTLRQARLLGSADMIAYEPGVAQDILDRTRADAARVPIAISAMPPPSPGLVIILRS